MKKITLLLLLIANFCLAQNPTKNAGGFATITGTQTIAPSAIIEARSTTKGVLLSPMTSTQMNAIASPANGLQVTNTSDGNKPYYFDGTIWRPVVGTTPTLAETLAIDNKTNDIPIFSNNGNGYAYVNDEQTVIGNDFGGTKKITMNEDSFAIETNVRATIDGKGLHLGTTTDGFGLPRLTTTQMNAIAFPTEGMLIRNTTEGKIYQFNGTVWEPLSNPPQTLAETLAEDNKTNDIPIASNNGLAVVYVNDDYVSLNYGSQAFVMTDTEFQLYSEGPVFFDSSVSIDLGTPVLKYNSEEVATQNWVTSQGYGTGTVNSVAVSTANGFAGSSSGGADPSLTISTTATGVLKGNGTAISAASAETDYTTPTGAGALTNKTMSGVTNTFTNIPQSAVTNLTTDLAAKQDKGNYRKLVAVDAGNTTHTGTLTETIVSSILIPANSLDALCDLFFSYDYVKSTGNATSIKVYLNTTNSLTGATLFASFNAGSPRNAGFFRKMILRGTNLDTQASTASLVSNWPGDLLFAATNVITLNPAVTNYMLVTITLTNSSDIITSKRTALEKLNLVP